MRCPTSSNGAGSLGEQAALLHHHTDQLMALKRLTAAMQITIARMIVMRVLSLLSVRYGLHFTQHILGYIILQQFLADAALGLLDHK